MANQPPQGSPQITPTLMCRDVPSSIEWLEKAFGFVTRVRIEDGDGQVVHCELEYGSGLVSIGGPTPEARSPKELGEQFELLFALPLKDWM